MSTTGFDVRTYMRDPRALRPEDFPQETTGTVSVPALNTLTYLWAVESNMLGRLRDVLVTPTHADSRVTAFLSTWAYEQHWLTTTLGSVLETHGCRLQESPDTMLGRMRRNWDERFRPTVAAIATNLMGAEITGAHMVTGWLDTAVLAMTYRQLGAIAPGAEGLTEAIAQIKDRHLDFYAQETTARLADNTTTRWLARAAVARWRFPGTRYAGSSPARAVAVNLYANPGARTAALDLDLTVNDFPGLSGLHPVRTALGRLDPGRPDH
jgi:hypothetical protein